MNNIDNIVTIIDARYLSDYCLRLEFNDGTIRMLDFEPFLRHARNPMIRKYLDLQLFKGFSLIGGDLMWNDYELCFPIADLYKGEVEYVEPVIPEMWTPQSILEQHENWVIA